MNLKLMLRSLLGLFVTCLLFVSCKKEEGDLLKSQKDSKADNARDRSTESAADGAWDLLGYGYDLTGDYANSNSAKFSIINIERLKLENPTVVELSGAESSTTTFEVGEDAADFTRKITNKTTLTGGDGFLFKGTIDYNFSNENKWSNRFIYGLFSQKVIKKRVYVMNNLTLLKNYLQPQFINDVNNLTPTELINIYGTHILSDIKLGGKMEVIYQAETNSNTRTLAASAGVETSFVKVFGVKTSGTYDETLVKSNYNQTITARTIGGASEQTINGLTIGADGKPSATINVTGWSSGITDANAELIEINGVIPIYDLISDPNIKAKVKSYVDQYLIDHNVNVEYAAVPVYEFYNNNLTDHDYSTNIDAKKQWGGWTNYGTGFYAYSNPINGAVPVYVFYNDNLTDHDFSTNIDAKKQWVGWTNYGPAFYAYKTQIGGTVPVYLFYNDKLKDHRLSTDINATANYSGWVNYGIAFYAFPK